MKALGRLFNLSTSATTAGTWFSLRDCSTVSITLIGATSGNATVSIAADSSGTSSQTYAPGSTVACDGITVYWTQNSGVWTKHTQVAAATFTAATGGLAVAEIDAAALPDGFNYISASHASGSFLFEFGDLEVQRRPSNLRSVTA